MRVVCVQGTWEAPRIEHWRYPFDPAHLSSAGPPPAPWYRHGSEFAQALEAAGHEVVDVPGWSTLLDGLVGPNDTWIEAGAVLGQHLAFLRPPVEGVVAWSHGGNVAAYALSYATIKLRRLVTLGTPVRRDVEPYYEMAHAAVERWTHCYGGSDWWQLFGELGDGMVGWVRAMPQAHINMFYPGKTHHDLVDPAIVAGGLA